jgi:hypothetical protein
MKQTNKRLPSNKGLNNDDIPDVSFEQLPGTTSANLSLQKYDRTSQLQETFSSDVAAGDRLYFDRTFFHRQKCRPVDESAPVFLDHGCG